MITLAATIIFIAIITHACINHHTLMTMRRMDEKARIDLQKMHHAHEMEFARKQAELFRKESVN